MIWTNPLGLADQLEKSIGRYDALIASINRARNAVTAEMAELEDHQHILDQDLVFAKRARDEQETLLREYRVDILPHLASRPTSRERKGIPVS